MTGHGDPPDGRFDAVLYWCRYSAWQHRPGGQCRELYPPGLPTAWRTPRTSTPGRPVGPAELRGSPIRWAASAA